MYFEIRYCLFKNYVLKNRHRSNLTIDENDYRYIESLVHRFNMENFDHKLVIRNIYRRGDYAGHFIVTKQLYWTIKQEPLVPKL